MIIEVNTFIEVENVPSIWAVELKECTKEMKPVEPLFVSVANELYEKFHIINNIICDIKPEKTNPENMSNNYKEVGFWHVKLKNNTKC